MKSFSGIFQTTINHQAITLRPKQPETYEGKRDFLTVNTWIYKLEQYIALQAVVNPTLDFNDGNKILFATTFLSGSAAIWWYSTVRANQAPITWDGFKNALVAEFVPTDHIRRARDKLRRLKQTKSVSHYLSEFRNILLTMADVTAGEKFDKFVAGLKREIRIEVMKSTVANFEEAAQIALRVDGALWSSQMISKGGYHSNHDQTNDVVPMEIGNVEGSSRGSKKDYLQKKKDRARNACFICHKVGCRPWKHRKSEINNSSAVDNGEEEAGVVLSDGSDPEN